MTVQVAITGAGDKTTVRLHQGRLAGKHEREEMRDRWRGVMRRLERLVDRGPGPE